MTVLMHLSDLHFGAHDPLVCAAVQRLAQRLGVAMVVVSGDLTQRATAEQFEQAARFVQGLHARSNLVLAGNHDLTLPLFCGVHNPRFTRPFCAVPRTSVFRTASG